MSKTILVIDDEPDLLMMIESRLKLSGYEVITASDGIEGINTIRSKKPDLVLLDLALPGIDGYEVCTRSKSDLATRHIPIILFTARLVKAIEDIAKELNADDFIAKPFEYQELLKKIETILEKKRI
ncbi:MAG: Alkaline phosphatase synthesis transcriptional regulatory protein PhoP [Elusimicrobia bacterium ADurb.Bin231]|nr:MAG: Alkaline phosphatase synthesis transcriptional regulatory protein PhoP [Elusimicrobia bacterium ADurb.Bin231]